VLLSGAARLKLDDDVVDLKPLDVVRVPSTIARAFEAGPEGAAILAFGAPATDVRDAQMLPDFWPAEDRG
jgi:hypothetical protein